MLKLSVQRGEGVNPEGEFDEGFFTPDGGEKCRIDGTGRPLARAEISAASFVAKRAVTILFY
jgi:hypothetical protein